jgi:hypothetical protein
MHNAHKPYETPADTVWMTELQQLAANGAIAATDLAPPLPKTGLRGIQYRDCVDVAVKLATLLDHDTTDYVSHDQIMASGAVKFVSNNKDITGITIAGKALRIKQVSDLTAMRMVNDTLQKQLAKLMQNRKDAQDKLDAAQHSSMTKISKQLVSVMLKKCRI